MKIVYIALGMPLNFSKTPKLSKKPKRRQDFLWQAAMGHFVQRCLQSALSRWPKFRFGQEKWINSTLFTAEGINTVGINNLLP